MSAVDCARCRAWVRSTECASHRGTRRGGGSIHRGTPVKEGFAALALHRPSRPENISGAMRTAEVYGVELVVLGGGVLPPDPLGQAINPTKAGVVFGPRCPNIIRARKYPVRRGPGGPNPPSPERILGTPPSTRPAHLEAYRISARCSGSCKGTPVSENPKFHCSSVQTDLVGCDASSIVVDSSPASLLAARPSAGLEGHRALALGWRSRFCVDAATGLAVPAARLWTPGSE